MMRITICQKACFQLGCRFTLFNQTSLTKPVILAIRERFIFYFIKWMNQFHCQIQIPKFLIVQSSSMVSVKLIIWEIKQYIENKSGHYVCLFSYISLRTFKSPHSHSYCCPLCQRYQWVWVKQNIFKNPLFHFFPWLFKISIWWKSQSKKISIAK